ncbi:MAG: ABC transporter permease [Rhodothermales bacterium]
MLTSYLKTTLRFFRRHKGYASINIIGLAIGLACSFFILLWIHDEVSYDQFHEDKDQLYRVMRHAHYSGSIYTMPAITYPLAQVLQDEYPEIEHAVLFSWGDQFSLSRGDQTFREDGRYAGPAFFEIYSYPLLAGDAQTALQAPDNVAISASVAAKYFGDAWRADGIIGQPIRVDNRKDFTVTAVFEDPPATSSYDFDVVVPIDDFVPRNDWVHEWGNNGLRLMIKTVPGVDLDALNAKIINIINDNTNTDPGDNNRSDLFLQPYTDIRLQSDFENGVLVGGRIKYVQLFGVVALFILLIASINFMNLATARSALRAREIGVRKAIGATKGSLVSQFLGESVVMTMVAWLLAMAVVLLALPGFNALTGKSISLLALPIWMWTLFLGLALLTGVLAGSYPALYLSSFNVVRVLRGRVTAGRGTVSLRKGLVVFQFALSILLIIGTLTVYRQIDYVLTKDLGLDKENVLMVTLEGDMLNQFDTFKQELMQRPGIAGVTASSGNPLDIGQSTTGLDWEGKNPDVNLLFHVVHTSHSFIDVMGMDVIAGRAFSESYGADSSNIILNQAAIEQMGLEDPVGKSITMWGDDVTIIGIIQDFHMQSMYSEIEPTVLRLTTGDQVWASMVRTRAGQTQEAIASLTALHQQFNPEYPLSYRFLDEAHQASYQSEIRIGRLANLFAGLAIIIACLGLFGLASFTAEQRSKEIGVRKVLGASAGGVVLLFARDFLKLVAIAFILAVPVAYVLMDDWLAQFAYRIEMTLAGFLVAGLAALLIAGLTVSYQSLKAALANPVDALKAE